jgi:hypothetical protein
MLGSAAYQDYHLYAGWETIPSVPAGIQAAQRSYPEEEWEGVPVVSIAGK